MAGVEARQSFQKERYAIKNNTDIIDSCQPEFADDPLTEIIRDGARRMLNLWRARPENVGNHS